MPRNAGSCALQQARHGATEVLCFDPSSALPFWREAVAGPEASAGREEAAPQCHGALPQEQHADHSSSHVWQRIVVRAPAAVLRFLS